MKLSRKQMGSWMLNHLNFFLMEDLVKIRDGINAIILHEIEEEQSHRNSVKLVDWNNPANWEFEVPAVHH